MKFRVRVLALMFAAVLSGTIVALPAEAQSSSEVVSLKISRAVRFGNATLQPGSYLVHQYIAGRVFTVEDTTRRTAYFVVVAAVSDRRNTTSEIQPSLEMKDLDDGTPAITSIYFPSDELEYTFSTDSKLRPRLAASAAAQGAQ